MTESKNNNLDDQLLAQMREDFIDESREILDRLGPLLVDLEKSADRQTIDAIFRDVHTLKGTAGFVGVNTIQQLAHKMEDIFTALRDESISVTPEMIDVAFESLNMLDAMQQDFAEGGQGEADISAPVGRLEAALLGESTPSEAEAQIPEASQTTGPVAPSTLRVAVGSLDVLITLVGELITARNALQVSAEASSDEALQTTSAAIDRITKQIQDSVTQMRLTPVDRLFNRFIPVVRKLARERDMTVNFLIEGGDTPFDRSIFEQMYDPLIHLMRNAIDHGLEPPAQRAKAGKSEQGTLRLTAERQGEDVILKISDDGRGIDHQDIRKIAVKKGLLNRERADALTDDQAVRLVFSPGLSTAEKVTETSGRGVGLDVVVKNVHSLRGSVDIETEPGQGTTFMIRLPITLAILQVMLVRSGEFIYALPLSVVRETMQLAPDQIHSMQQGKVVFVRDVALRLRSLDAWLHPQNGAALTIEQRRPAVVLRLARGDEVLLVDELIGRQQIVIQPLSPHVGEIPGVDGTAILPDGQVTLILDVEKLAQN